MPLAEGVKRAGSFEALLPYLRDGRILARRDGLYSFPGGRAQGGPGNISPRWWAEARYDTATGRVIFTFDGWSDNPSVPRELFATGVELERAPVEARWSATLKPPGRKRGVKPSPVWQQIFRHFDPIVARKGKFPSVGSAASSVETWLKDNNKSLSRSAIERGIPKYRPDWIAA
jgi:hypothetical protein